MSEKQTYLRFEVARRIEHLLLILSFSTLAVTGLVQKFALSPISQAIVGLLGGIELTRIIHRTAAILFIMESLYHLMIMGFKLYVKREKASMLPGLKDAQDGVQALLYNLGFTRQYPRMGRYNFMEKLEYLAMLWGLVLMALTGFVLWNPIATVKFLPGVIIPASKVAHGMEAILAVLAIILWHFYFVHLRHWNWSMLKGTLTRHEMEEEHAEELEGLEKGAQSGELLEAIEEVEVRQAAAKADYRRRLQAFIPTIVIVSLGFIYGFYRLATFEQTAITTLPQPLTTVQVYVSVTATPPPPATATPLPSPTQTKAPAGVAPAALTWNNGISDLFKAKCGACHGSLGDLSVASYSDLVKGGKNGPVITLGDSANSPLVKMQSSGNHPGLFSAGELKQVEDWIKAGALEK